MDVQHLQFEQLFWILFELVWGAFHITVDEEVPDINIPDKQDHRYIIGSPSDLVLRKKTSQFLHSQQLFTAIKFMIVGGELYFRMITSSI